MKVKVGKQVFDAAQEPVMLILTPEDRANIAGMAPEATKYAAFPDTADSKEIDRRA